MRGELRVVVLSGVLGAALLSCGQPGPEPLQPLPLLHTPVSAAAPDDVSAAPPVTATSFPPTAAAPSGRLPTGTPIPPSPSPTPTIRPSPSPTPAPRLSLEADLPWGLSDLVQTWASEQGFIVVDSGDADLRIDLQPAPDALLVGERIYVPVQRFATLREGITLDEVWLMWSSSGTARLLVTEETVADLSRLWGAPDPTVELVPDDDLTAMLWQDGTAVAIVPFERLEPRLRPLALDGLSAVDNRLQQSTWPLALRVWLHGSGLDARALSRYLQQRLPATNRDPNKLTVLVMTGVTAMSRGTACVMERYEDPAYPAHAVGPELAAADITHISNEVPFVAGCDALCDADVLELCSKPEYIAALLEVGADIVGLTGNHQNDFGYDAMLESLEVYAEHGLPVYGGGANDEEARQPLFVTQNGNRLAFLGANQHGPGAESWYPQGAWATEDNPGSARFDMESMTAQIAALRPEVDLVLVEIQYTEAYHTVPLTQQKQDFEALSAAGVDIVTGVQAHQPQAVAFTDQGLILYGLGNLFFDQMDWWETRQGLIARHTIYDGHHISTELLVTILEEWSQPRWATDEERVVVLSAVFAASGW